VPTAQLATRIHRVGDRLIYISPSGSSPVQPRSDTSEVASVGPGGAPPHIDEVGRVMAASGKVK
jgi:hypothetical protein